MILYESMYFRLIQDVNFNTECFYRILCKLNLITKLIILTVKSLVNTYILLI